MVKKIICYSLLLALIIGILPGCHQQPLNPSQAESDWIPSDPSSTQEVSSVGTTLSEGTGSDFSGNQSRLGSKTSSTSSTGTVSVKDGEVGAFLAFEPSNGSISGTLTPTFTWSAADGAQSYTLILEEYNTNGTFQKKFEKTGIKTTTYQLTSQIQPNTNYRWIVYGVSGKNKTLAHSTREGGNIFMAKVDYKTHPANKGLDFTFKGTVSEKVLRNYLSRSMIVGLFHTDLTRVQEDLRMIYNTGAKYIGRAGGSWAPNGAEYQDYPKHKEWIAKAHKVDPEIVFEACIFETVFKSVEEIAIPSWVFEAFGQPVEKRNFSYQKMIFTDGLYVNHWGTNASVPDITRVETQMFFYYRACSFIDQGYEGLHMGQVHLIGARDTNWVNWTKVLTKIRAYAKKNARRGFVFINAHTHGLKGSDGKLLFDFHAYPFRGTSKPNAVAHAPSENNPQEIELKVGYHDSIYQKSLGGTTYSGWSCDSLPYFVELDNWNGYTPDRLDQPTVGNAQYDWWGFDEISWFANQPQWYRIEWLNYAYQWVRKNDSAGYAQMPGNRTAALRSKSNPNSIQQLNYYNNSKMFDASGFDDEMAIRQIWIDDRNSR